MYQTNDATNATKMAATSLNQENLCLTVSICSSRPTARPRQAGPMMYDCKQKRHPGLTCSRNVRIRSRKVSHAPQIMSNKSKPSKHQPTVSKTFRRAMPKRVQLVATVTNATTPKNKAGENRNGPQRHIFGFGGAPSMIAPVLGRSAANNKRPNSIAATALTHRQLRLLCSIRF